MQKNSDLINYVSAGLVAGMTVINLEEPPEKHSEVYKMKLNEAKEVLNYLADEKSQINMLNPDIYKENKRIIKKARRLFPSPKSENYLMDILNAYCNGESIGQNERNANATGKDSKGQGFHLRHISKKA